MRRLRRGQIPGLSGSTWKSGWCWIQEIEVVPNGGNWGGATCRKFGICMRTRFRKLAFCRHTCWLHWSGSHF